MSTPTAVPQNAANGSIAQSPDEDDDFEVISENTSFPEVGGTLEKSRELNSEPSSERPSQAPALTDLFSIFSTDHEREALQPILDTLSSTQGVLEKLHKSLEDRNVESQELRDNLKNEKEKQTALLNQLDVIKIENEQLKATEESLKLKICSLEAVVQAESERALVELKKETEAVQTQSEDQMSILTNEITELKQQLNAERGSRESLMVLMAKLNDELQKTQSEKSDMEKKNAELKAVVEQMNDKVKEETLKRTEAEMKAERSEAEVVIVKSNADRQRNEMIQQSLVGSDENLQRLAILERSLGRDAETRKQLESALNQRVTELHSERQRIAELCSRIDDLNKEKEELKEQAKNEVDTARDDANVTMQELAQLLHNVDDIRNELNEQKAACEKARVDLNQCQNEKQNYELMLADCMNENRNLAEVAQIVQRERDEIESECRALRTDYNRRLGQHQD